MTKFIGILFAAFILDSVIGDPVYARHPVRLIGISISRIELLLRKHNITGFLGGILLVLLVLSVVLGLFLMLRNVLSVIHLFAAYLLDLYIVYSCISLKDLLVHANAVKKALRADKLADAGRAAQKMVGRDTRTLDAESIARATVESIAENFVDGFLASVFWYVVGGYAAVLSAVSPGVGGVCFILAHRIINTMDAMVGYQNEKYIYFGKAAAKLDDAANFIPARIAVPVISLSAWMTGLSGKQVVKIALRDRLKNPSPNAGHAESAVAGALHIRLGGPITYAHGVADKPWLGDGTNIVRHDHITLANRLIRCSGMVVMGVVGIGYLAAQLFFPIVS